VSGRSWWAGFAIAVLAVAGLLVAIATWLPPLLSDHDKASLQGLTAANEYKHRQDVRATLIQAFAGLFILASAIGAWRQVRTAAEGQVTERLTRAVDQLGHKSVDVRVGGICALGRLMEDSRRDYFLVLDILSAFLRSHRPSQGPSHSHPEDLRLRAPDIQAAAGVIARRPDPPTRENYEIWLHGVDLGNAALNGANLRNVRLDNATLAHASLRKANLAGARLKRADLSGAHLRSAQLDGANLEKPNLTEARLFDARLAGSRGLDSADLDGALASPRTTTWPPGFDPVARGVVMRDEDEDSD
jgi:hypothetical protein